MSDRELSGTDPMVPLDSLAASWREGDQSAGARLASALHVRFLAVAKRRVRTDDIEDVVQEALRIVSERHGDRAAEAGILMWGYTVLRNVIGNYYQARAREGRRREYRDDLPDVAAQDAVPAWDIEATSHDIAAAVAELSGRNPRCGMIFRAILASLAQGGSEREMSARALTEVRRQQPDLERNAFYVALHRCRAHLRELLAARSREVRLG